MILIQNFYTDKNPARNKELLYCINKNIDNPFIKHIIFIYDNKNCKLVQSPKIINVPLENRPTFTDLFKIANCFTKTKIIANSDIYFNETLQHCQNIAPETVYALCRWDFDMHGQLYFYNHADSQDAWLFSGKIECNVNYGIGWPGSDNGIAYELDKAGYKVKSPALTVQAIHWHKTNLHNYDMSQTSPDRIKPPYLRLTPHLI